MRARARVCMGVWKCSLIKLYPKVFDCVRMYTFMREGDMCDKQSYVVWCGRARNVEEHILGILMYSYGIKCCVLHCFAMQCSFQECKPNVKR
jgi:hypothetical protein